MSDSTTRRQERLDALQEATDSISIQTWEDIEDQAKLVAGNMLLMLGDKAVLTATGFVYAAIQMHTAALAWAVSQGYATFTEKALASEEERAERKDSRVDRAAVAASPDVRGAGGYV